jgi:hypothetical protein
VSEINHKGIPCGARPKLAYGNKIGAWPKIGVWEKEGHAQDLPLLVLNLNLCYLMRGGLFCVAFLAATI